MGAWIEIVTTAWVVTGVDVAPFMGAWIEITVQVATGISIIVAPFMGAWIEIPSNVRHTRTQWSHPLWVRGLK